MFEFPSDPEERDYLASTYANRGFVDFDAMRNTVIVATIEVDRTRCTCGARPPVTCPMAAHG